MGKSRNGWPSPYTSIRTRIILDEPTAGQDQRNYTEIMEFLDSFLQEKGHAHCHDYPWYAVDVDYSDRALCSIRRDKF